MAKSRTSLAHEVETATISIDQGLRALNELAKQCGSSGVSGEMLAVCVERMTSSMLASIETLYNVADKRYAADRRREVAHG